MSNAINKSTEYTGFTNAFKLMGNEKGKPSKVTMMPEDGSSSISSEIKATRSDAIGKYMFPDKTKKYW